MQETFNPHSGIYQPDLVDKETFTKKLSNLPKITQLLGMKPRFEL